ncbi:MAG: 6,7-dimethyl-8-ribityllumazine synthase [Acidobacteria bacterium]|nr:MAG: 6,7-dimethyl-8-ribityllumazine synthase [Acidobacteriota bacterium]
MKTPSTAQPDARGLRVLVLRSTFNAAVVDGLVAGARAALDAMGSRGRDVTVVDVPGAFELPLAAAAGARSRRFDAIVALGAVIRGETDHYEHIAREASAGLAAVARESGIPVGFGVLTVGEEARARARSAAGPGNKGAEAARAAVAMARLLPSLRAAPRRARKIV